MEVETMVVSHSVQATSSEIEKTQLPDQDLQVLYIEDDVAMRSMFRMTESTLLKPYRFTFAETLAAAIQELGLNPKKYSAIISDYHLPDGEAKDLFPLPPHLPIIVLTGTYNVDLAVALMKLGVDDFLVKDKDMQFLRLIPEKIKSVIDKKAAEIEARRQERRFRDLFENSNDIIQYLSAEGKILQASPPLMDILGYEKEDTKRLTIFDMVHAEDRLHYRSLLNSLSPGQKFDDIEVRMLSKSGKTFIMEANASKGLMSEDQYYTRAIFRDVTEKKKSEKMIKRQNVDLAEKNRQINEGLAKLRKASVSKKSSAIVFILALLLFLVSEFWIEPFLIKHSGNTNYQWVLKIIIVLLLKPFDMLTERWLIRQKIKEAGLE
jgi:PAS domain S-box-containing protein